MYLISSTILPTYPLEISRKSPRAKYLNSAVYSSSNELYTLGSAHLSLHLIYVDVTVPYGAHFSCLEMPHPALTHVDG